MFGKILETAYESGAEVIVQLKEFCCDQYKGRVLDLNNEFFSIFHSGSGGGVHWAFKRDDIAFIGLVVELPDLNQTDNNRADACLEPLKTENREDKGI